MGNVKDKLILGRIKHRMQGNNRLQLSYIVDTNTLFPFERPNGGSKKCIRVRVPRSLATTKFRAFCDTLHGNVPEHTLSSCNFYELT